MSNENKFIVRFEWEKCIGSAVCEAVCPAFWKVTGNKSVLNDSAVVDEKNKVYEVVIKQKDLECNVLAADGCPPRCISVFENGKKIAPK